MAGKETQQPPRRVGVFGLGRFGAGLAIRLAELGAEVLAVDSDAESVESIDPQVARAVCLDATNAYAVKKLNVDTLDLAIVCIGRNIQSGLLIAAVLQEMDAREIWVRAIDQSQAKILEAMGVSRIISLEQEMAQREAQRIMQPGIQMIAPVSAGHSLAEVKAKAEFVGKSLAEIDFRNAYGVNIVAIKSRQRTRNADGIEKSEIVVNDLPWAGDVIQEGDVLVVIGDYAKIRDLQAEY